MSRVRSGWRRSVALVGVLALVVPLLLVLAGPVSAATVTVCPAGPPTCNYATITAAVGGETYPVTINVYPGTYSESVDLYKLPGGDVTLIAVNSGEVATSGAATVNGGATGPAFHTSVLHSGDVIIDGFVANSTGDHAIAVGVNSSVSIHNVTAHSSNGQGIRVWEAHGDVNITDCEASMGSYLGIQVLDVAGNVSITNSTANDTSGFQVEDVSGNVSISGCTANNGYPEGFYIADSGGNVTISESSAIDNDESGFYVQDTGGDVSISNCTSSGNAWADPFAHGFIVNLVDGDATITNCTAKGNRNEGFNVMNVRGRVTIDACVSRENSGSGVRLDDRTPIAGTHLVNGSILCGNGDHGLHLVSDVDVDAAGNWWGCAGGPGNLGCDSVDVGPGTVAYMPWIDTISSSGLASVMIGDPTLVSFQFSDTGVYLGQGPGDLHGAPTFIVTTDNGSIAEGGFINAPDGVMEVTLVPEHTGTATVWVDGPCGLDESIVLGVVAAQEFVPELGTVLLLGSGLMGLAGYAGLRLGKR